MLWLKSCAQYRPDGNAAVYRTPPVIGGNGRPQSHILTAFGASLPVDHISSGQGTTWLARNMVLKPLDMTAEQLYWQAEIVKLLIATGEALVLRLAAPLPAKDGTLIVDGWTAWDRLDGTSEHIERWDDIIAAGNRFCELTQHIPRPSFLDARQDPWAVADRIAWGEQSAESVMHVRFVPTLLKALASRLPVHELSQLIHGDLTGNVLFSPDKAPAVIDISPYWRPPSYATAVVLVDALTWEDAPLDWARGYLVNMVQLQAFIRALLFRILSDYLRNPTEPIFIGYERSVELVYQRLATSSGSVDTAPRACSSCRTKQLLE